MNRLIIPCLMFLCSCSVDVKIDSKPNTKIDPPVFVTNISQEVFMQIKPERKLKNGFSYPAEWQKIKPLDTNNTYFMKFKEYREEAVRFEPYLE